ncbi:A24 family peptidase [Isosphaeraceae bacterium EP7]
MPGPEQLPLVVAAAITLVAAATDLRQFKVYNWLTFPALLGGLLASTWFGGLAGLGQSMAGATVGFCALVVFFAAGGVGAGDVKLLTALGAWLGPRLTLEVCLASALAAGLYALVLVVRRGGTMMAFIEICELGRGMLRPGEWARPAASIEAETSRDDRRHRLVPFAAMTCVGFFAALAWHRAELDGVRPTAAMQGPSVASTGGPR